MTTFSGSCLCGKIRYECSAEPFAAGYCQCRHCQRVTGTGHSAGVFVPKAALKVTGKPSSYNLKADSGNTKTYAFCPKCGAPLLAFNSATPDAVFVRTGSMDDPSRFQPQMIAYADSAHSWDYMDSSLPKFGKMPPG